ncbi:hypothetical protein ACFOY2_45755 [Nonomuraea purpurea]|uniref:Uncharacterized protein n=1 Tax=Nonomuraea purpurea TaxID=1849276 RepID=A0ABV8GKW4_9ACTN
MTYVKVERPEEPADDGDEVTVEEHMPAPAPAEEEPEPITDDGGASPAFAPGRTLLVGGLATATLLVTGLYQLAGVGGLVGGGVAAAGAGAAYVAHRRGTLFRKRPGRGGSGESASTEGGRRSRRSGSGWAGLNFPRGKSHSSDRRSAPRGGTGPASAASRHGGRQERFDRVRRAGRDVRAWVNRRTGRRGGWRRRFGHAWDIATRLGLHALFTRLIARARRLLGKTPSPGSGDQPGTDDKPQTSTPADSTPADSTPPRTERTTTVSGSRIIATSTADNPLVIMSAEMIGAASSYAVPDMMIVAEHLDALHQVGQNLTLAYQRFGARLQAAYPIHAAVVEHFQHLVKGSAALIPPAQQLATTFRLAHADDIARREKPRTNEHLWNMPA